MQKFIARFSGLLVLFAFVFTACEEDDPIIDPNPVDDPPSVALVSGAGLVDGDETVDPAQVFTVRVEATAGTADLNSLEVLEDGNRLANSRFTLFDVIGNKDITPVNNPQVLAPITSNGQVEVEISITAPDVEGPYTYTFEVTDGSQLADATEITITVENPLTPLSDSLTGVLLNQAGPAGTGGLDLDTGDGTGSSASESEIRDMGLDCTIPAPGLNWRRQIGTINGAEMRAVDMTAVENFTFDNVSSVEEILGAYESGIELNDGESINCANASTTEVTDVTEVLTAGDMFVVFSNDTYYLIRIDEVNETDMNNNDNYVISIKY